nr:immunoglobulin heavy chain junction region [Homo sapiens]
AHHLQGHLQKPG